MNRKQLFFYKKLVKSLEKKEFIDIGSNYSYLYLYAGEILTETADLYGWNSSSYERLKDRFTRISEHYWHDKKLRSLFLNLAHQCLLGLGKYEEYLEKTEPRQMWGGETHENNFRLNIQKLVGLDANPIDVIKTFVDRKTRFISSNETLYKEKAIKTFEEYAATRGGWFKILIECDCEILDKQNAVFDIFRKPDHFVGDDWPTIEFGKYYCFYGIYSYNKKTGELTWPIDFDALSREAENQARVELGVPKIGEGWIAETELFRRIETEFPMTNVIQHGRPFWLGRQHFDIWIPEWKIAVEYHGKQHFEPVEFFGGVEAFNETVKRDRRKAKLAAKHNVKLFVVTEEYDVDLLLSEIDSVRP